MPTPIENLEAPAEETPAPIAIDSAEERRYSVVLEGLQGVDDEPALVNAFDAQSALRAGPRRRRQRRADRSPLPRRCGIACRAPSLARLFRCGWSYPRIETAAGHAQQVVLAAEPGRQYTFQSVELPGLDAAGRGSRGSAPGLRRQVRRPGHRRKRHQGRHRPPGRTRRRRFRTGRDRRAADRDRSSDPAPPA